MSHTTRDADIHAAISSSMEHGEIVTILVESKGEAESLCDALREAAIDAGLDYDGVDTGPEFEVWAFDPDADDKEGMAWRVHVQYEDD